MSVYYRKAKHLHAVFAVALGLCLSGCADGKNAGSVAGGDDATIKTSILSLWQQDHPDAGMTPGVAANDGVVILTGTLPSAQMQVDAVREAWQPNGVREVVNELGAPVSRGSSFKKDTSLTIKLRSRLTFDPDIASTNYAIQTIDGVIYLMGIAKNQEELTKVIQLASDVGASQVVSYVKVKTA